MDSKDHNKVIAFDTLFSTNQIQMLKIMLPYLDNQMQKTMAVYIKFLELRYTIDFYQNHPYPLCGCLKKDQTPDFGQICTELLPYCTEKEKKQLEQFRNIFKSMEMYQEMMKTMEMMKDFMPDMDMGNLFQNLGGLGDMGNMGDLFHTCSEKSSSKEPSSDSASSAGSDSGMINMLMNMLSPEQKELFELFGGNDHAE